MLLSDDLCFSTTDVSISFAFSGDIILVCGVSTGVSVPDDFSFKTVSGIKPTATSSVLAGEVLDSSRSRKIFLS